MLQVFTILLIASYFNWIRMCEFLEFLEYLSFIMNDSVYLKL